jgi:hypothetical protein
MKTVKDNTRVPKNRLRGQCFGVSLRKLSVKGVTIEEFQP